MEVLSEHLCEGWLEGYLLTGRHGLFSCYEAFIHIIDSMFNQHAKWLKVSRTIPWRKPIASLNYLLTSHVWRQDHNGFSHQDPGFIDHVANKKADIVRIYLPPDANCLLSVADHCLRSRNYINLIVAGKQPEWQWLDIDAAVRHCTAGAGIWDWASNDAGDPDVVMACAGDVPTLETLAAVTLLREYVPDIRIRVVNVVDLMVLQPQSEHPARPGGPGLRRAVHHRQAGDLRLSRLSRADSQADLPAAQSRQFPCPRLQGRGHHDHALRHGRAEQSRPLPACARRHPADPAACRSGRDRRRRATGRRWSATSSTSASTAKTCRRFATGAGPRERSVVRGRPVTGAEPRPVLALNSGSSFDAAFHAGLPQAARVLSIPKELRSQGIRRYGFHGLSCAAAP